jgi:hypothetical protein
MSTVAITLPTYNSANIHVNDVNAPYAEVVGGRWHKSLAAAGLWVSGATSCGYAPLSQCPGADSLLLRC